MHRVEDPADPQRCNGSVPDGQCMNRAEEGSEYCLAHNGVNRAPARRMRQYLLARVEDQRRLAQLSESEEIKSLREDVSLAVMMFERRWNLAKTDTDFIAASPQLDKMLLTVERLKKSLLIVEKNLGTLLSHDAAMSMAQTLVQITLEELESLENWEPVAERIIQRFEAAMSGKPAPKAPLALTSDLDALES